MNVNDASAQLATQLLRDQGLRCPVCDSAIDVQADVESSARVIPAYSRADQELPTRLRVVPFVAFCTGCEWAIELKA